MDLEQIKPTGDLVKDAAIRQRCELGSRKS